VALVLEQTIPTERLPLVGEVNANSRESVSLLACTPLSSVFRILFSVTSFSIALRYRSGGPGSIPGTTRKEK
jgi:hypothetical protein